MTSEHEIKAKTKSDVTAALVWAGGVILLALGATVAKRQDWISQDTVLRIVIGANGLMIAWFGNRVPKTIAPTAYAQRITRVSGWSTVISGLIYAALWAFAPIDVATIVGIAVVLAGVIVVFTYCFWLRTRHPDTITVPPAD